MKKNKLGIIIVAIAVALIAIGVLADYLYSIRIPRYEQGKIVAVTMILNNEEEMPYEKYYAYKGDDGCVFAYEKSGGERQEFGLYRTDFNKLIRYDYSAFMSSDHEDPYAHTIFEFEDGTTQEIPNWDVRVWTFFLNCEKTFIDHKEII